MKVSADVRSSYSSEKRWEEMSGDLPAYLLFRPISFLITPFFQRLGVSAMAVSSSNLALACVLPLVALHLGAVSAGVLTIVIGVLDCLDGNLARLSGRVSKLGAYVDLVGDRVASATVIWSCAALAERDHGVVHASAWATLCIALVLLGRICRDWVAANLGQRPLSVPRSERLSWGQWIIVLGGGLEHLYGFALIVAGLFGRVDVLLYAIVAYSSIVFAVVQWELVRALRA